MAQTETQIRDYARILRVSLVVCFTLAIGILVTILISSVTAYSMDEFSVYHAIACIDYPFNSLNVFRDGCYQIYLGFLGSSLVLPLRGAAWYVGSLPSLYYLPLFLIWRDPLSARFLGFLFLAAEALALSRISRLKYLYVLGILVTFFAYLFQHIVDTGPVAFQLLAVFLCYVLFEKWSETLRMRFLVLAALLMFLSIWIKISFFWLLPGIGLFLLFHIISRRHFLLRRETIGRTAFQGCVALLIFAALTLALFLSTPPQPYLGNQGDLPYFMGFARQTNMPMSELVFNGGWLHTRLLATLLNPLEATGKAFAIYHATTFTYVYDAFVFLSLPLALLLFALGVPSIRRKLLKPAFLFALFPLTLLIIARARGVGATHHTLLAFPFLLLGAATFVAAILRHYEGYPPRWQRALMACWGICFVSFNAYFFSFFPKQATIPLHDFSRMAVHQLLNSDELATRYFTVAIDFNMYFYQSLYGPKQQSVLYMEPLKEQGKIDALRGLENRYHRKVLFVYSTKETSSDMKLVESSFTLERCKAIPESAIWQVLIEKDPGEQTPCDTLPPGSVTDRSVFPRSLYYRISDAMKSL